MNGNLSIKQQLLISISAFLLIVFYGTYNLHLLIKSSSNHIINANAHPTSLMAPTKTKHNNHHIHTINDNSSFSLPSSKNINNNKTSIRISFTLHDPQTLPFSNIFAPAPYGCNIGSLKNGGSRTAEVPPSLLLGLHSHGHRVLDFTTTINTNLKILSIGDSVTIQIAEALDEMMGGYELQSRKLLWDVAPCPNHCAEGGTLVAPTHGGGMHGAWRMTGLLSKQGWGGAELRNRRGGGWKEYQVNSFLGHEYFWEGQSVTVEKVDAVIFRVMHGWMEVHEITRERVVEAAELAHEVLGATTIVFMTVPFTNNVNTLEIMEEVRKINDMIWDVAISWHLDHKTHVLVMDYAAYSNHIIWTNARHLGYNVSDPLLVNRETLDVEGPGFLLERLEGGVWPPSIPHVCNKKPTNESGGRYCEQNYLFKDGMHFCPEMVAARIGAGVACLLGCVYNEKGFDESSLQEESNLQSSLETPELKIRACERQCNEQFLSVAPVKWSWVDNPNITLASFSGQ